MKLIKVGISGCLGRMGQDLVNQTINDKRVKFVGGFDIKHNKNFLLKIFKEANAVIDFSLANTVVSNIKKASENGCCYVLGTTGLDDETLNVIKK